MRWDPYGHAPSSSEWESLTPNNNPYVRQGYDSGYSTQQPLYETEPEFQYQKVEENPYESRRRAARQRNYQGGGSVDYGTGGLY